MTVCPRIRMNYGDIVLSKVATPAKWRWYHVIFMNRDEEELVYVRSGMVRKELQYPLNYLVKP